MPRLDYAVVNLDFTQQDSKPNQTLDGQPDPLHLECDSKHVHIFPAPKFTVLKTKKEFDIANNLIKILYLPDGIADVPENWKVLSPHDTFPENTFLDYEVINKLDEFYNDIQRFINSISYKFADLNFNTTVKDSVEQLKAINDYLSNIIDNSTLGLRNITKIYKYIAVSNTECDPRLIIAKFNSYNKYTSDILSKLIESLDAIINNIDVALKKHIVASFHLSKSIGICEKKLEALKILRDKSLNENRNQYVDNIQIYIKKANQINLKFRQDLFSLVMEKYRERKDTGIVGIIHRFIMYRTRYFYNQFTGTKIGLNNLVERVTNKLTNDIKDEELLIEEFERIKTLREKYNRIQKYINETVESMTDANDIYAHILNGLEDTHANIKKFFFDTLAENPSLAYKPKLIYDLPNLFSHFIVTPWLNLDIDYNKIIGLSRAYNFNHVNEVVQKLIEQYKATEKKRVILQSNYDLRKELEKTQSVETKRITNILIYITIAFTIISVLTLAFQLVDTIITKIETNNTKWYQEATIWLAHISAAVIILRSVFNTVFDIRLISIAQKTQINKYEEEKHLEQIKKYENESQQSALDFIKGRKSVGRDFQLLVDYLLLYPPGGNEIFPSLTKENYQNSPLVYLKNLIKYINSRDFYISLLHGELPVSGVEFGQLYKPIFGNHVSLFYHLYQNTFNFFEEKTLLDGRTVVLVNNSHKCSLLFNQDLVTKDGQPRALENGYSWLFFEVFSFVSTKAKASLDIYRKVGAVFIKDDKFKNEVRKFTHNENFEEEINLDPILTEVLLFFLHVPDAIEYIADIITLVKNKYGKTIAKVSPNGMLIDIDPGYTLTNDIYGRPISIYDENKKLIWMKPKSPSPFKPGDFEKRANEMLRMYMDSSKRDRLSPPPKDFSLASLAP